MQEDKKPWKIKYREQPWASIHKGSTFKGEGFFEIFFNESRYGFVAKDALDKQNTDEILSLVEGMLNDAYSLAIKENR